MPSPTIIICLCAILCVWWSLWWKVVNGSQTSHCRAHKYVPLLCAHTHTCTCSHTTYAHAHIPHMHTHTHTQVDWWLQALPYTTRCSAWSHQWAPGVWARPAAWGPSCWQLGPEGWGTVCLTPGSWFTSPTALQGYGSVVCVVLLLRTRVVC